MFLATWGVRIFLTWCTAVILVIASKPWYARSPMSRITATLTLCHPCSMAIILPTVLALVRWVCTPILPRTTCTTVHRKALISLTSTSCCLIITRSKLPIRSLRNAANPSTTLKIASTQMAVILTSISIKPGRRSMIRFATCSKTFTFQRRLTGRHSKKMWWKRFVPSKSDGSCT